MAPERKACSSKEWGASLAPKQGKSALAFLLEVFV
jgi:hypothetical protein